MNTSSITAAVIACLLFICPPSTYADDSAPAPAIAGGSKIALVFNGGHDTVGFDRGRPVILIAAALNVPPEVFRDAFSHVKPAGPGRQPQEAQVRLNKQALMQRLGPLGVTDDRLNEVSNYYRYRRESGELWRHVDAQGFATVQNGVVTGVTITNPGAGYSSLPTVSVPGTANAVLTPVISYGTDLPTNGSISKINIGPAAN